MADIGDMLKNLKF